MPAAGLGEERAVRPSRGHRFLEGHEVCAFCLVALSTFRVFGEPCSNSNHWKKRAKRSQDRMNYVARRLDAERIPA